MPRRPGRYCLITLMLTTTAVAMAVEAAAVELDAVAVDAYVEAVDEGEREGSSTGPGRLVTLTEVSPHKLSQFSTHVPCGLGTTALSPLTQHRPATLTARTEARSPHSIDLACPFFVDANEEAGYDSSLSALTAKPWGRGQASFGSRKRSAECRRVSIRGWGPVDRGTCDVARRHV